MNLVPRNRLFDFDSFFEPNVFRSMWPGTDVENKEMSAFSPRVDIKEKKGKYEITAELPGVKKDDINVSLHNGILSLQAETRQEIKEEEEGQVIRQERRYGTFFRSFDLGPEVQDNDVHAEFNDGLLKIVAPKIEDKSKEVKRISIR